MMKNKKLFGSLMLFCATLIWGLSYTIQSLSSKNLGPFTVVFFKGLGGFLLLPLIILGKHRIDKKTILSGMLIGLVAFGGCIFQQFGIMNSTVSKAGFITTLYIIFVPLFGIFLGSKPNKKIIISVLVAVCGLYFLCFSKQESLGIGDTYLLICSLIFALQIILIDRFTRKHDPLSITFISQSTICVLSSIFMFINDKPTISAIGSSLPLILYMVFISGMIAQTIQIVFQKDCGPELSSLIMSFESVFSTIFGWIVLSQVLSIQEIFGCVLVFIGILIAES